MQHHHHQQVMQPMMVGSYASSAQITTDIIQQYLDENKQLILAILDSKNSGKSDGYAENQAKLQWNLMYLAAIADSQPQVPIIAQCSSNALMQSNPHYMTHQQAQQMTPMSTRSSMLYSQPPMSALTQQQQAALHNQFGMSIGESRGSSMLLGQTNAGSTSSGLLSSGVFPDFGHSNGAGKSDLGSRMQSEGCGGSSEGQNRGGLSLSN